MKVPIQTAEIFKILSKGQFISANSSDKNTRELFNILDDNQNYENLYAYFLNIQFNLEKGDDYFYFSRIETKVDLENKIKTAYNWIDILDFFKTFDNAFHAGFRFSPSEILVRLKVDAELEDKLKGLRKIFDKENYSELLDRVVKKLEDETFIELENKINDQYKVLSSFKYLEQLMLSINIAEEIKDETSK